MKPWIYESYMDPFVEDETNKMMQFVEITVNETNYFKDNLQIPFIRPVLEKAENRKKIVDFTGSFIDANFDKLSTSGPVYSFSFGETQVSPLYELFGLTSDKVLTFSNEMFTVAYGGTALYQIVREAPHKILLTAILVEALQKNYEDIIECCKYLIPFAEYPILYRKFWRFNVDENVMSYTIEHLPNKFKIKAKDLKSLLSLLKYDMEKVFDLCKDRLKSGIDYQYINFIYRFRNQLKATFKKIRQEYQNHIDDNATQRSKSSKTDDGSLADPEGHATNIASMVENAYTKISSNGVNVSIIRIVSDGNNVDKDTLMGFLNQIYTSKDNKLYEYIEAIVTSYILKNPTDPSLNSGEFLRFGLTLYRSIGTSKNPLYQKIRSILNIWMFEIINIKNYYQNQGTIINYTRAIFNYMIMMIQSS